MSLPPCTSLRISFVIQYIRLSCGHYEFCSYFTVRNILLVVGLCHKVQCKRHSNQIFNQEIKIIVIRSKYPPSSTYIFIYIINMWSSHLFKISYWKAESHRCCSLCWPLVHKGQLSKNSGQQHISQAFVLHTYTHTYRESRHMSTYSRLLWSIIRGWGCG